MDVKKILKKGWHLFITRQSNLLERDFRLRGYHKMGCSEILVIYKKGFTKVFLKKNEYNSLVKKSLNFLIGHKSGKNIKKYEETAEKLRIELNYFSEKEFDLEYFKSLKEYIAHATCMPVYIEFCVEKENIYAKDKKLVKKLSELRYKYRKIVSELDEAIKTKFSFLVDFYTVDEAENFLKTGKALKPVELSKRKRGCLLYFDSKKSYVFTEVKTEFLESINKDIKIFKGTPAYGGRVRGKVLVVKDSLDLRRIKKDDIIAIHMTEFNMMHFLKNIKALITDEGGVTTHAAVFSREFKIPCIMSTKIATQVLKDGDLVEVDANRGIIKIMKRAG